MTILTIRKKMLDLEIYSQSELARRVGISRSQVCSFFKGRSGLSWKTAESMGKVLGFDPAKLMQVNR